MLSRIIRRRLEASLQSTLVNAPAGCGARSSRPLQKRWMTPAPKPGDGPLMSRRADRELPDIDQVRFRWRRTLPIFVALVSVCSVAIFNYQKTSSPIVSSTLYALRTNTRARELLGEEIYFKHQIPWIRGKMNQMQGKIDIYFTVKGTRGTATMRFASNRPSSRSLFETTEWSLTTEDGEWIDLLDGGDPFKVLLESVEDEPLPVVDADTPTRGFRQQGVGALTK